MILWGCDVRESVANLWERFISTENFSNAVVGALRNKRRSPSILRFISRRDEMTAKVRDMVRHGEFRTGTYVKKVIHEPKRRDILILPFFPDRIVHHALVNIVEPIWDKMFIHDSYACRTGRGIHAASRRIMTFIRKNRFFLQCDISKFYPNIRHDVMFDLVCRSLRAPACGCPLTDIFHDIIYSVPGGRGMPIGNLTSQWLGNLYMNELDRYVKDVLHARCYVRYCDDFVLFSGDKRQLNTWREQIREFLLNRLGLTFSYAEIAPVSNGVDFCGYRHFPHTVLARRRTLCRMRRRAKKINQIPIEIRRTSPHVRGQIASMHGWLKHCRSRIVIPKI